MSEQRMLSSGDSVGSTPKILIPGRCSRRTRPTPVRVPPVPMPATKASKSLACSRNSRAVVSRWIAGLAGLVNCEARIELGVAA